MQKGPSETSFSLNNVLIDPSRNLIGAHDDPMRVEPKVMALLVRLKESMGQTLSWQTHLLWPAIALLLMLLLYTNLKQSAFEQYEIEFSLD